MNVQIYYYKYLTQMNIRINICVKNCTNIGIFDYLTLTNECQNIFVFVFVSKNLYELGPGRPSAGRA